mgnify:CR=1 FL=1
MNKNISTGLIILVIIGTGVYFFMNKSVEDAEIIGKPQVQESMFDAKNSTFTVENAPVTLVDGVSEVALASIPDAKITTRYFGNEAKGDLNFDGRDDVAFLVTQDGGGSGTFYYVVVALKTDAGYATTNAFFVGDRIAPQTTEIQSQTGELRVNFAQRKADESMTTQPSVGATLFLKVTPPNTLEGLMK